MVIPTKIARQNHIESCDIKALYFIPKNISGTIKSFGKYTTLCLELLIPTKNKYASNNQTHSGVPAIKFEVSAIN